MPVMTTVEALSELKITTEDGRLVDAEGCSHEELADLLKTDSLGMCGCGFGVSIVKRFGDILKTIHERKELMPFRWDEGVYNSPEYKAKDAELRALCGGDEVLEEIMLQVLDKQGMLEHGTSISGSWLTEKGHAFMVLAGTLDG
jgi:hypothetical protein